jgi:ankyrin repeat protein
MFFIIHLLSCAALLIDAGADVNAAARAPCSMHPPVGIWQFDGLSSLQLSASQEDEDLFLQLLRAGADPCRSFAIPVMSSLYYTDLSLPTVGDDVKQWQLVTPLIWAVKNRKVAVVTHLLSEKIHVASMVDVNAVPLLSSGQSYPSSSSSWTPLMWAIANLAEDVAASSALASDMSSSFSSAPDHSAAHQIFEMITRFPGMNPKAGSVCEAATPLSLAAALGLDNVIQLLADMGSSILETTALFEATSFSQTHSIHLICRIIMERHASSNIERSKVVPLLVQCLNVAAQRGLLEGVRILTSTFSQLLKEAISDGGAEALNADWEKGLASALLHACMNGQPHMTTILVPLTTYSPSVLGSALRNASKNGDSISCEKLLSAGASADWVDSHQQKLRTKAGSRTAVSAAFKRWGRTGMVEYEACCSLLLDTCSSSALNVRDSHGSTPLKWAAIRGHHTILRALLDKGADVFAEDSDGNSAMSHAVMHGHSIIICELVEHEPQLYKSRLTIPSYFKLYEPGLLPPTVPISSRELHFSIAETEFRPQITTQISSVLCARSFEDLKLTVSLTPILSSAHNHELVVPADPESHCASYIREHLNILKIRDIASSCPDLPLPEHVGHGDTISEVARIGIRSPMKHLIRAATSVGKGAADIRSVDGDSLLLLCCGHNWRDEAALVIEAGCPVDCPSRNDPFMTAIVWAAHKGYSEIVSDLIHAGSRQVQIALLIASSRCHVTVLECICKALADMPAPQLPDTSCAMLIAAAHGSAPAILALASISPVPQIIADLRCSCVESLYTMLSPTQDVLTDTSKQPAFFLSERDPNHTKCFRRLLPGAFRALLHHQFEQRAIQKELEWESSETTIMGFNFKNKLMHAHQNLDATFGSEDWSHRMKLTRASLLSSLLPEERPSRPSSRESDGIVDKCHNGSVDAASVYDTATSEFLHEDSFFVSENVRPLVCINDDGLNRIQSRRQTMRSSFWQGATCSLQLQPKLEEGHTIISANGRDLSDVTWMLLIPDTTPLHMAAASGSSEALKSLLSLKRYHPSKHSAPSVALSSIDSSGLTPLCYAARFADSEMCGILLDLGADVKPWEQAIEHTMSWISNRQRWRSLLAALVSIHAATSDVPLLPHSSESAARCPSNAAECDGLVCIPCILWAALSGSEDKTRLLVEAGADAVNALSWIQTVGFGYCQENSYMHKLAVSTLTKSQDYILAGPYAPTARAGDEVEGVEPIPSIDHFPISSYKRYEVPPGHRVQIIAAIIAWNDWSLRKLITFHDVPQDHYAVLASNSGKSQQLPGKPDYIQAVQLHVDEFVCEAVVVIGANYILGVRFTTNQRILPWMGRNWGDDECKIQRVVRFTPQGREICGFFGLKASSGRGRLLHLGFVARLRAGSDCMRRHRQGVLSKTQEWLEPVKAYSMENALKQSVKKDIKGKIGTTPRSNTPWMRSPLPGRNHSPFPTASPSAVLLNDFENSEKSGLETAFMNHVLTESPKMHGGSKSSFITSDSSPPISPTSLHPIPARLLTSVPKKPQRPPTSFADKTSNFLPNLPSSNRSLPTSPLRETQKPAQRKQATKKKDTM